MKTTLRIIFGCLFLIAGIGLIVMSGPNVLKGQLEWLTVLVAGFALLLASYSFFSGRRIRTILEDLFTTLP